MISIIKRSLLYSVKAMYPLKVWEGLSEDRVNRFFNSCFNMTLDQLSMLVMRINFIWKDNGLNKGWQVKHLLWTLSYLKTYPTYDNFQCIIGHDKKTIKKWVLYTVDLLAEIDMVSHIHKDCAQD